MKTRVALLTDIGSVYSPLLLRACIECDKIELHSIYLTRPRSNRFAFAKAVSKGGRAYALARVSGLLRLRLANYWERNIRHRELFELPSPSILEVANRFGINVVEIDDINNPNIVQQVCDSRVDVVLSAFFGQILRRDFLDKVSAACVNLHPSLLPDYAGTHPVFWALANDEVITGLTAHLMTEKVDDGPILLQVKVPITPNDTHHSLYRRIATTASPRLRDLVLSIGSRTPFESRPFAPLARRYFSHPTKEAFERFRSRGRRFY